MSVHSLLWRTVGDFVSLIHTAALLDGSLEFVLSDVSKSKLQNKQILNLGKDYKLNQNLLLYKILLYKG